MSEMNTVTAAFTDGCTYITTLPLYQWDYGQVLQFSGIELPFSYQVHFSNEQVSGTTVTVLGDADGVLIPDSLLETGKDVYAFVYLHSGESDGETEYKVVIPVLPRPQPSDVTPTPSEQSIIDQTIAALNAGVTAAEGFATNAEESAQDAYESATGAHDSELNAEAWAVGQRDGVDVEQTDETYHNNSKYYAEKAEQGASTGGFIQFYINSVGHLIYEKTANVDLAFSLRNGHLIVEG